MNSDHTPVPWKLDETWMLILGPKGEEICAVHSGQPYGQKPNRLIAHDNAELIVRLVNCHQRLIEALRLTTAFAATHTGNGANANEGKTVDRCKANGVQLAQVVEFARESIAEATGREQEAVC